MPLFLVLLTITNLILGVVNLSVGLNENDASASAIGVFNFCAAVFGGMMLYFHNES